MGTFQNSSYFRSFLNTALQPVQPATSTRYHLHGDHWLKTIIKSLFLHSLRVRARGRKV